MYKCALFEVLKWDMAWKWLKIFALTVAAFPHMEKFKDTLIHDHL